MDIKAKAVIAKTMKATAERANVVKASAKITLVRVNDGAEGNGINSTVVTYQAGASQTTAPTGTWTTSVPKLSAATPYLWTKTVITYTDGKTTTSYSVSSTLDGVEVGGRNYIRNMVGTKPATLNGITVEYLDNKFHVYGTNTKTEGAFGVGQWIYYDDLIVPGETWTLSIDRPLPEGVYIQANTDKEAKAAVAVCSIHGGDPLFDTVSVPAGSKGNIYGFFGIRASVKTVDFTFRIKFERGNKATDWTPAPEDVQQGIDDAFDSANDANNKVDLIKPDVEFSKSQIEVLNKSISSLVVDQNGGSMMTQTPDGWRFNIGGIQSSLSQAMSDVTEIKGDIGGVTDLANRTGELVNDLEQKTAYINMSQDDAGSPVLELGKKNGIFKVRITDTAIEFLEGSQKIAYITNRQLYIQSSVVTDEMKIGAGAGFIWKKRGNGNMGLRYVTS